MFEMIGKKYSILRLKFLICSHVSVPGFLVASMYGARTETQTWCYFPWALCEMCFQQFFSHLTKVSYDNILHLDMLLLMVGTEH